MWRRGPPGEPGVGEVERSPEQVHRAGLADEPGAEHLEDALHLDEREPEPPHGVRVVAGVDPVVRERDRVGDLDRHRPDLGGDTEVGEQRHRRSRRSRRPGVDQVERTTRRPTTVMTSRRWSTKSKSIWNAGPVGCGISEVVSPRRRHVQRDVPPVVDERLVGQAHLADHLGVQVQGVAGVLPVGNRDRRPAFGICHSHGSPPRCVHSRRSHETPLPSPRQ